jgi:hypothetical protein
MLASGPLVAFINVVNSYLIVKDHRSMLNGRKPFPPFRPDIVCHKTAQLLLTEKV